MNIAFVAAYTKFAEVLIVGMTICGGLKENTWQKLSNGLYFSEIARQR